MYLRLFLRQHRADCRRRLRAVRDEGDGEGWLDFWLAGITAVADEAVQTAQRLHEVVTEVRSTLLACPDATESSIRLFELLPEHPVVTVSRVIDLLDCSRPAAGKALQVLEETGIVAPVDDRKRDRAWRTARRGPADGGLGDDHRGDGAAVAGGACRRGVLVVLAPVRERRALVSHPGAATDPGRPRWGGWPAPPHPV